MKEQLIFLERAKNNIKLSAIFNLEKFARASEKLRNFCHRSITYSQMGFPRPDLKYFLPERPLLARLFGLSSFEFYIITRPNKKINQEKDIRKIPSVEI